jgi:hypothetical protein
MTVNVGPDKTRVQRHHRHVCVTRHSLTLRHTTTALTLVGEFFGQVSRPHDLRQFGTAVRLERAVGLVLEVERVDRYIAAQCVHETAHVDDARPTAPLQPLQQQVRQQQVTEEVGSHRQLQPILRHVTCAAGFAYTSYFYESYRIYSNRATPPPLSRA